ncbi:MAG TPA: class I SAM-dependent methyltransferase [Nocardioides sp.]|nr:class I SAM-dependent methyltransferase [Nocardioides sp.]
MTRWQEIARATVGADYAAKYAQRFRALAARGDDVHGEASFVCGLVEPPARVLDAGCGTGRVAIRLAELGYGVVGVDLDASMLIQARAEAQQTCRRPM